jgi:hypothetical protein
MATGPQVTPTREERIKTAANALAEAENADIYFYNSEIKRPHDEEVMRHCGKIDSSENAILILVTEGGDPDAAYRIARCFQSRYADGTFTCIVPGYCKSAGTLIAVGAHELVMTESGELGPLDIQMSKKDELWESQSGLTVTAALRALHERSYSAFEHFFLTIKRKGRSSITLRMATEIAAKMTSELFAPIFQQVDPMHVGESFRATAIANHYGIRLSMNSGNLEPNALDWLITAYPTHGFVIDRAEAEGLFKQVRPPSALEQALIDALGEIAYNPAHNDEEVRQYLSEERKEAEDVSAPEATENLVQDTTGGPPIENAGGNANGANLQRQVVAAS